MKRGNGLKRKIDAWIGIPALLLLNTLRFSSKTQSQQIKTDKIAILIFGAIGDATIARTITDHIHHQYPKAILTVYLSEENAAASFLFEDFQVEILKITALIKNLRSIRKESFDVWIDTSQWARISALYSYFSNSQVTIGFKTPKQYRHFLYDCPINHRDDVHEIQNFNHLLTPIGIHLYQVPRQDIPLNILNPFQQPYIVLHFFASGYFFWLREWPLDHWKVLIDRLHQLGYLIVLSGSPSDQEKLNEFLRHVKDANKIQVTAGKYRLQQLIGILKGADAVISVNTSIVHLASLVQAKIIALNGPTNSLRWGACGAGSINIDVPKEQGGGFLNLGFEYAKQPKPIMDLIQPQQVVDAILSLKERSR